MPPIDVSKLEIRRVEAAQVRPMRQRVLRPTQGLEQMAYAGDDDAETVHLVAVDPAGRVLGIASYYTQAHPHGGRAGDWRLRGMAVEPSLQGQGLGGRLVRAGLEHLREQGGKRLWCNARISAQPFYEKLGFIAEGERFEIEPIGPHTVMSVDVE